MNTHSVNKTKKNGSRLRLCNKNINTSSQPSKSNKYEKNSNNFIKKTKKNRLTNKEKKILMKLNKEIKSKFSNEELTFIYLLKQFTIINDKPKLIKLLTHINKSNIAEQKLTKKELNDIHFYISLNLPKILYHINKGGLQKEKQIMIEFKKSGDLTQIGGAYLKRLEDKGDEPITGNDLSMALDEIANVLQTLQYTSKGADGGLTGFNLITNLLRGNEEALNMYLKFYELPKYASLIPPSLNIGNILRDVPELPMYLNLHKTYRDILNQYKIEQGEIRPEDIKPSFLENLGAKIYEAKFAAMKYTNPVRSAQMRLTMGV